MQTKKEKGWGLLLHLQITPFITWGGVGDGEDVAHEGEHELDDQAVLLRARRARGGDGLLHGLHEDAHQVAIDERRLVRLGFAVCAFFFAPACSCGWVPGLGVHELRRVLGGGPRDLLGEHEEDFEHREDQGLVVLAGLEQRDQLLGHHVPGAQEVADVAPVRVVARQHLLQVVEPLQAVRPAHEVSVGVDRSQVLHHQQQLLQHALVDHRDRGGALHQLQGSLLRGRGGGGGGAGVLLLLRPGCIAVLRGTSPSSAPSSTAFSFFTFSISSSVAYPTPSRVDVGVRHRCCALPPQPQTCPLPRKLWNFKIKDTRNHSQTTGFIVCFWRIRVLGFPNSISPNRPPIVKTYENCRTPMNFFFENGGRSRLLKTPLDCLHS